MRTTRKRGLASLAVLDAACCGGAFAQSEHFAETITARPSNRDRQRSTHVGGVIAAMNAWRV